MSYLLNENASLIWKLTPKRVELAVGGTKPAFLPAKSFLHLRMIYEKVKSPLKYLFKACLEQSRMALAQLRFAKHIMRSELRLWPFLG